MENLLFLKALMSLSELEHFLMENLLFLKALMSLSELEHFLMDIFSSSRFWRTSRIP